MHIILVPDRLATARTLKITPRLLGAGALAFIAVALAAGFLFYWVGVRLSLPFAAELVTTVQDDQARKNDDYLRDNLSAMAVRLGEMQAQLIRLDSLSDRLVKLSGAGSAAAAGSPASANTAPKLGAGGEKAALKVKGGQGGPLILLPPPLAADELQREIDRLGERIRERSDDLTAHESRLMERRIKSTLLPTIVPIDSARVGSTFGRRVDPIAGVGAMHEGVDFVADSGTRVIASAGGVVTTAEFHPQYGKLIEIDHGNDFSSRYAHLSKLSVKPGQIVKRGQTIGSSGNTGRSTGPHLHFEVRFKGVAQNPSRFLQPGTQLALDSAPGEAPSLPATQFAARPLAR